MAAATTPANNFLSFMWIPPKYYINIFKNLQAPPPQQGDHLCFDVGEGNGAKIPAVLGLRAVVSQDEDAVRGDGVGVLEGVFRVGGVKDLAALGRAVDDQRSRIVQCDEVVLAAQDTAHPELAVLLIEHHVVLGVSALQPVADEQVAVLDGGEHAVAEFP